MLVWLGFFLLITFVIAHLKVLHFRERELSRVDQLTQVATRLAFYEFATTEINRARRSGLPTTLAYVDLDCFKEVNDRSGHATGDRVLKNLDKRIREETGLSVCIADDPLCCVVTGAGKILTDFNLLRKISIE
jgi:GGDEF domain-containing protein